MTAVGPPPKHPKQPEAQKRRTGESSRSSHFSGDEESRPHSGDAQRDGSRLLGPASRNGADAESLLTRVKQRCTVLFEKVRSGAPLHEIMDEFPELPGWTVSLVVHIFVLTVLSLFHMTADADRIPFEIITDVADMPEELNVVELTRNLDREEVSSDAPVSLTAGPQASVSKAVPDLHKAKEPTPDLLTDVTPDAALPPSESELINDSLSDSVEDLVGAVVNTDSDAGSVDQITIEIRRRLQKSKVLVVWVMDASASLRTRREQIIARFDRVYHELDELGGIQDDALLTALVAFGKTSVAMIEKPTADREEIQKAVRDIKTEESGVENVFAAIGSAALEYRKFQTGGRKTMLVVLTDEIGDDLPKLEDTIKAVKRYRMPVYVMGPTAPFGSRQIKMKWTDEATGEVFFLPVDRGPETVYIEHAKLPSWGKNPGFDVLSSGFGPYGLSRLVRDSGGIYFLYDDGNIPGPRFKVQDMLEYFPDYVSPAEYTRVATKSPLRLAVLRVAQATQSSQTSFRHPPTRFLSAGIQFEIRDVRKTLARMLEFIDSALTELNSAEKFRDKETSKRWLAHYDLFRGRLLANRVRCRNYAPLLDEMYAKPRAPKDGTKNAWELAGDESTTFTNLEASAQQGETGQPTAKRTRRNKNKKKEETSTKDDVRLARESLQRVVEQHPHTPWAVMAQNELEIPLGFKWQETFIDPPKGEKLPWDKLPWDKLTEEQKAAKKAYEARQKKRQERAKKREEAKKRLPKL